MQPQKKAKVKGGEMLAREIMDELEGYSDFSDLNSEMAKSDNSAVNRMSDAFATSFLKMIKKKAAMFAEGQIKERESTSPKKLGLKTDSVPTESKSVWKQKMLGGAA